MLNSALTKRRKTYHRNPNFSVPKSTLWRWKKNAEINVNLFEDSGMSNINGIRYKSSDACEVQSNAGETYSDAGEVHSDAVQHAVEAEEKRKPILGVKGTSVLSSSLNLIEGVPIDYMHAILEGISRRILSVCLDSKNHSRRYYLGRATEEIDKRLKCIKPPPEFRRTPVSSFKQWKASEFRAWLLYYCLPVLYDLLPSDYIYHLSLLDSAVHILLKNS